MKNVKSTLACLGFVAFVFFARPSSAGQSGDDSSRKSSGLMQQSKDAIEEADAAEENGDYAAACTGYRNGADLMERAIYATLGMTTDPDYDMDAVLANNERLQRIVDTAKEEADQACSQANQ